MKGLRINRARGGRSALRRSERYATLSERDAKLTELCFLSPVVFDADFSISNECGASHRVKVVTNTRMYV